MKYANNICEEELKNKVAQDFFGKFDRTEIIKDIDFAVKAPSKSSEDENSPHSSDDLEGVYLLWAEVKKERDDIGFDHR